MKIAYLLAIAMVFGANLRSETGVLQPDGLVSTLLQQTDQDTTTTSAQADTTVVASAEEGKGEAEEGKGEAEEGKGEAEEGKGEAGEGKGEAGVGKGEAKAGEGKGETKAGEGKGEAAAGEGKGKGKAKDGTTVIEVPAGEVVIEATGPTTITAVSDEATAIEVPAGTNVVESAEGTTVDVKAVNEPCGAAGLNRDFYVLRGNKTSRDEAEKICKDGNGKIADAKCPAALDYFNANFNKRWVGFWINENNFVDKDTGLEKEGGRGDMKYPCEYDSPLEACLAREKSAYTEGSKYGRYQEEVTKEEAIYACEKNGGYLASLNEEGSLEEIMGLKPKPHGPFWVSGENTKPNPTWAAEGTSQVEGTMILKGNHGVYGNLTLPIASYICEYATVAPTPEENCKNPNNAFSKPKPAEEKPAKE